MNDWKVDRVSAKEFHNRSISKLCDRLYAPLCSPLVIFSLIAKSYKTERAPHIPQYLRVLFLVSHCCCQSEKGIKSAVALFFLISPYLESTIK